MLLLIMKLISMNVPITDLLSNAKIEKQNLKVELAFDQGY